MTIHYVCRHCNQLLGELDASVSSTQLGLDHLTLEERVDMISFDSSGKMTIKVICEDCQEAYERNPSYHGLDWDSHIQ